MLHLMKYKVWFFVGSLLIIIPGLIFILMGGLKFGIDFTGGGLLEYKFEKQVSVDDLKSFGSVVASGDNTYILRTPAVSHDDLEKLKTQITEKVGKFEVRREEN